MRKNYDIYYMLVALILVIIDLSTSSSVFDGLAFVAVLIGFALTVIPKRGQLMDERYHVVKAQAGYIAFMLMTIVIGISMYALRSLDSQIEVEVVLRYLMMSMYFLFASVYVIMKRVI